MLNGSRKSGSQHFARLLDGEKLKAAVCIVAVLGIATIETIALLHGINGVAMSTSAAAIGAIGGWWGRKARE